MAEKIEKILVDITGLSRYHENLKTEVLSKKQDVISDLEDIRSKANNAAGSAATAEQNAKDYADSLAVNYDAAGAADAAEQNAKSYVDGKVDGKFDAAGSAAQALEDAKADAAEKYQVKGSYETAGAAAQALADAKDYADSLASNYDESGSAAQALADAKDYANGLAGNYDESGAAAQALVDAKAYVDGKVDGKFDAAGSASAAETAAKAYADRLATNYDAAGTAAGLNTAMDARVKVLEAIDHDKLAADASAAAVATVLDGAPEKFDTLKEVAQWISDSESAADAADLVTRVKALEDIDHEAYKAADETVLASAKSYADGLASNYDESGAAAQALADAKTYVDGKVDGKFDAAGAAAQALADAKADAASLYQVKIDDLQTIRDGAALGATALQSVPEEYVTETELTGKGYLTANDFGFATDADIDKLFEIQ